MNINTYAYVCIAINKNKFVFGMPRRRLITIRVDNLQQWALDTIVCIKNDFFLQTIRLFVNKYPGILHEFKISCILKAKYKKQFIQLQCINSNVDDSSI